MVGLGGGKYGAEVASERALMTLTSVSYYW